MSKLGNRFKNHIKSYLSNTTITNSGPQQCRGSSDKQCFAFIPSAASSIFGHRVARLLQHHVCEVQKPVPVNLPQTVSATANVVARVPNDPRGIQRWHGCFRDGLFT